MRIISREHDYYDGVQHSAIDTELVYLRERRVLDPEALPHPGDVFSLATYAREAARKNPIAGLYSRKIEIKPFVLLFCGAIHRGVELSYLVRAAPETESERVSEHFYEPQAAAERLGTIADFRPLGRRRRSFHLNLGGRYLEEWLEALGSESSRTIRKGMIEAGLVAVAFDPAVPAPGPDAERGRRRPAAIVNPVLADYGFYRVFDAWQAFQEISLWLGGVLRAGEPETVAIDDSQLAAAKGFDRWSFRRPPVKRRS